MDGVMSMFNGGSASDQADQASPDYYGQQTQGSYATYQDQDYTQQQQPDAKYGEESGLLTSPLDVPGKMPVSQG